MSDWNQGPLWKRAALINAVALLGIVIGFASLGVSAKLSPTIMVALATPVLALVNLTLLATRDSRVTKKQSNEEFHAQYCAA